MNIGYFIHILECSHKTDENALYAMVLWIWIWIWKWICVVARARERDREREGKKASEPYNNIVVLTTFFFIQTLPFYTQIVIAIMVIATINSVGVCVIIIRIKESFDEGNECLCACMCVDEINDST